MLEFPEEKRKSIKEQGFISSVEKEFGADVDIRSMFRPAEESASRTRAKLSVAGTVDDPVIGLLDKEFNGIELCSCPLHFEEINDIFRALPSYISEYRLTPYDVNSRKGELKGIIVRSAVDKSSLALRFVLRSTEAVARIEKLAPILQERFPLLKAISVNIQPVPHQIVEGEEEIYLGEQSVLWEKLGKVELAFQPRTFAQATPEVAKALYEYAAEEIKLSGVKTLLDLYCGVGGFLLNAAGGIESGIGVELSAESIDCAKLAAEKMSFKNLEFYASDVDRYLENYKQPLPDAVLLNPPRRGVSSAVIDFIKEAQPQAVFYSSCNPETLFRDIKLLEDKYLMESLKPFDMFVLSNHIEVFAVLKKRG